MKLHRVLIQIAGFAAFLAAAPTVHAATLLVIAHAPATTRTVVGHNPAAAVHTATQVRHHRHAHLHHARLGLHADASASLRQHQPTGRPVAPAHPAPRAPMHRAAVPALLLDHRAGTGTKAGSRYAMAAPSLASLAVTTVAFPGRARSFVVEGIYYAVVESRGPPRAGPFSNSPSLSGRSDPRAGSFYPNLSPAPSPSRFESADTPGVEAVPVSSPLERTTPSPGGDSNSCNTKPERPPCRSHANRPEGAVACCLMPSAGGTPS